MVRSRNSIARFAIAALFFSIFVQARDANATSFVQLPGSWGGGPEVTIEAWVNTSVVNNEVQAIVSSTASGQFAHLQVDEGTNEVVVYADPPGCCNLPTPNESPTGVWRYVVLAAESSNTRLLIDGVVVASDLQSFTNINSSSSVLIGAGFGFLRQFYGSIDEVAIYDTALSDARILAHFNAASALDDSYRTEVLADSPLGYWPLNDAGTTIFDASGNGRDGATVGDGILFQVPGALSNGDSAIAFIPEPSTALLLALGLVGLALRKKFVR